MESRKDARWVEKMGDLLVADWDFQWVANLDTKWAELMGLRSVANLASTKGLLTAANLVKLMAGSLEHSLAEKKAYRSVCN